jgi:hypothetical protein
VDAGPSMLALVALLSNERVDPVRLKEGINVVNIPAIVVVIETACGGTCSVTRGGVFFFFFFSKVLSPYSCTKNLTTPLSKSNDQV